VGSFHIVLESCSYLPSYVGRVINSNIEKYRIVGLTDIEEEFIDTISYSISFSSNECNDEEGAFPLY
jgi:hypothetical protein